MSRGAEVPGEPVVQPAADLEAVAGRLALVSKSLEPLEERYRELMGERDELIGILLDGGWTQPQVAWLCHLQQPRINQIWAARRNGGRRKRGEEG